MNSVLLILLVLYIIGIIINLYVFPNRKEDWKWILGSIVSTIFLLIVLRYDDFKTKKYGKTLK